MCFSGWKVDKVSSVKTGDIKTSQTVNLVSTDRLLPNVVFKFDLIDDETLRIRVNQQKGTEFTFDESLNQEFLNKHE